MSRILFVVVSFMLIGAAPALAVPPLEDMVRVAEFTGSSISPDGRMLAVATPVDERTCLTVLNIEDPAKTPVVHQSCPPGGESVLANGMIWANNERVIFRTTRQLGSLAQPVLTGRVFAINADGSRGEQILGPRPGSAVYTEVAILDVLPEEPEIILVASWTYTAGGVADRLNARVERVNIYSGRSAVVMDSPLLRGGVLADSEGRIRFVTGSNVAGEQRFAWRRDENSPWIEFSSPFDADISPLRFTEDGEAIIVSSRQQGELGLWRVDLEKGERSPLVLDERSDVRRVIYDRAGERVIGAAFEPDYPAVKFIDEEHPDAVLWRRVMASFPGREVDISGFTRDGSRALVTVRSDREPWRWYLLDAASLELRFLKSSMGWIDPAQLSAREPFRIRARDGLELTGYLTLPPDGREQDLPAVIVVHGGPHGVHDDWGFDMEAQLLASRGFAVVQLNYRGSGGYGQQFERSGYRKWGTAMQDDVTDATMWLINEGIADRERVCIYGGSYGGYATLAGITREPDLYACAFTYVGVYDLDMLHRLGDIPQRPEGRAYLDRAIGDRRADAADIAARSPVNHVARIKTPLYVAHGRKDERVPIAQYNALTRALDEANIPYESLVFPNEGHGVSDPENRVKYYSELLRFLQQHTAPRVN
jgi:dipeptidyl aminopeptidase/acylaminoacyl peptidase